jgi:NADH-quinone oxidoreductase subunit J
MDFIMIVLMLVAAIGTVMTTRLLRSAIGLALVSVILSIVIYRMGSPQAAVFELSVCAGLITVIFFTAITFTRRLSQEGLKKRKLERFSKFWFLPFLVAIAWLLLSKVDLPLPGALKPVPDVEGVKGVIWNVRHMDLIAQISIILAGALGVVVLFRDRVKR